MYWTTPVALKPLLLLCVTSSWDTGQHNSIVSASSWGNTNLIDVRFSIWSLSNTSLDATSLDNNCLGNTYSNVTLF